MALHPEFPSSPYACLEPEQRWFPAAEELGSTAYEKLLPPLVANIRGEVKAWRDAGYAGASATSRALLQWWFEREHLTENADGTLSPFLYYFAQREAVETVIWLHQVRQVRDKFDLLRYDASGAVSAGMFDEQWPRYVLKMATGVGKTRVLSLLIAWSYFHKLYEPDSALARNFLLLVRKRLPVSRATRTSSWMCSVIWKSSRHARPSTPLSGRMLSKRLKTKSRSTRRRTGTHGWRCSFRARPSG